MTETKTERTYQERLDRFETAQEGICMMMAKHTRWIHEEQAKADPDPIKIAQWDAECTRLNEEMDAMGFDDDAAIDHVFQTYGPILRAARARATEQHG
ncbi:MAG: hypothetical protein LBI48_01650 [Burkholderiaceae bacterium]|jgi:hypothetical protein|nr:hypothetical protein [Burkholderiaceae bacterium]